MSLVPDLIHRDTKQDAVALPKSRSEAALRWLLVAGTGALLIAAYFAGMRRGLDAYIVPYIAGPFLHAVCAVATKWLTGIGDYVCLRDITDMNQPIHGIMYDLGLREANTNWNYLFDTKFVDHALAQLFAHPHWTVPATASGPPYDGIQGIGWGMDEGYYNFANFAFHVFGPSIEALYKGYWLLLGASVAAYLVAFRRALAPLVLLLVVALVQYMIFSTPFLWFTDGIHPTTEPGNPRFLSCLCVVPLLHCVTLARGKAPLRWRDAGPLAVQSLVLAMAVLQRMTVIWVVVAMALLAGLYWLWRRRFAAGGPQRRYYSMAALTLAVCVSTYSYLHLTTHPGFAANGYTHGHNFWFAFVYDLQIHPAWKKRYAPIYGDANGDILTEHVCRVYLANHREEWPRWNPHGVNPFQVGLPQIGLENLCRKAFFEFARRDPIYVAQVWLIYNPRNLLTYTGAFLRQFLSWLVPLPAIALIGVGLICGLLPSPSRRDIAFYCPLTAFLCVIAALPNLASLVIQESLTDYFDLLAIMMGMAVVSAGITIGVCLSSWMPLKKRKLAFSLAINRVQPQRVE